VIISRNTLVKNSTSIQSIWNTTRQHFGFQITGAHFIDFAEIHLEPNERPEDLYQRLMAFMEDILLKAKANSSSHHGDLITETSLAAMHPLAKITHAKCVPSYNVRKKL